MKESELKSLHDEHWEIMFAIAKKYVVVDDVAMDVVSEVFIKAWSQLQPQSPEHAKAYLLKATIHRCISSIRSKKINRKDIKDYKYISSQSTNELDPIDSALFDRIIAIIEGLPCACKNIFKLYWGGATTSEVSEKLGIGVQNALNQKAKAIRVIKHQLSLK